ncbi:MAG: hypothetical protein V4454_11250 [Pseudomonadota bacterium]
MLNRRLVAAFLFVACAAGFSTSALAAPAFGEIIVSDDRTATESDDGFEKTTAKIFVLAELKDAPSGTRVASSWVAVNTNGVAPNNFVIDTAELTTTAGMNKITFNLSKPNAGWPLGSYRVDLSINGAKKGEVKFKVE